MTGWGPLRARVPLSGSLQESGGLNSHRLAFLSPSSNVPPDRAVTAWGSLSWLGVDIMPDPSTPTLLSPSFSAEGLQASLQQLLFG